ncbi:MAG: hypothetical protein NWE94_04080 [Candidatus Bathyarchaeota archaeon]|nr:hypothetical protein [Candidatus Bathyarchaeota archaeon]
MTHRKLRKGRKIANNPLNVSPKNLPPSIAIEQKIRFQNKPTKFPAANTPSFLFRVPFNSNMSRTKKESNSKSVAADSKLTKRKAATTHSATTTKSNTENKRAGTVLNRFTALLPSQQQRIDAEKMKGNAGECF